MLEMKIQGNNSSLIWQEDRDLVKLKLGCYINLFDIEESKSVVNTPRVTGKENGFEFYFGITCILLAIYSAAFFSPSVPVCLPSNLSSAKKMTSSLKMLFFQPFGKLQFWIFCQIWLVYILNIVFSSKTLKNYQLCDFY